MASANISAARKTSPWLTMTMLSSGWVSRISIIRSDRSGGDLDPSVEVDRHGEREHQRGAQNIAVADHDDAVVWMGLAHLHHQIGPKRWRPRSVRRSRSAWRARTSARRAKHRRG